MSAEIISLDERRAPPAQMGNGAREALIDLFTDATHAEPWVAADILLMELWRRGFVIVPFGGLPDGVA